MLTLTPRTGEPGTLEAAESKTLAICALASAFCLIELNAISLRDCAICKETPVVASIRFTPIVKTSIHYILLIINF